MMWRGSRFLVLVVLVAVTSAAVANGSTLTGPLVNPANAHSYYLLGESTWQSAEDEAVTLGGHLVTINDSAEQSWVFSTFSTYNQSDLSLWIGLREVNGEGDWQWVNGEAVSYMNWATGEPNNAGGESYVHMIRGNLDPTVFPNGVWNDLRSPHPEYHNYLGPFHGVVEVDTSSVPEPTSLVLLSGLGVMGLVAARRRRKVA